MNNNITNIDIDIEKFKENIMFNAKKILPHASLSSDPQEVMVGVLGCIPDTYEWFLMKFTMLEPDDKDGLIEWADYIIKKTEEYLKKHNSTV